MCHCWLLREYLILLLFIWELFSPTNRAKCGHVVLLWYFLGIKIYSTFYSAIWSKIAYIDSYKNVLEQIAAKAAEKWEQGERSSCTIEKVYPAEKSTVLKSILAFGFQKRYKSDALHSQNSILKDFDFSLVFSLVLALFVGSSIQNRHFINEHHTRNQPG